MDPQGDDHAAVEQAAKCGRANAYAHPQRNAQPGRNRTARTIRAKVVQYQRCQHRSQRINCSYGQVNAAGDDDECRADGHDGDETGVLRQLGEVSGVEELVLLNHDAFRFARGVLSEFGQVDSAAKNCQQQAEHNDHNDQTAFLKAKSWTGRRPVAGGEWTHVTGEDASKRRSVRQGECRE